MGKKKATNPELREFYGTGKRALEEYKRIRRGRGRVPEALASLESRYHKNRLIEARRFAQLYNAAQLDWLCGLGQKKGRPLTKDHVRELLRLPDREQRNKLAKQCAEETWSLGKLALEIAVVLPGRRYSGSPMRVPVSVEGKLVVTERLLRNLIRWVNVLSAVDKDTGKPPMKSLPKNISQRLDEISALAKELESLCAKRRGQPAKPPREGEVEASLNSFKNP